MVETLFAMLKLTYRNVDQKYNLERQYGVSESEFLRSIFAHIDADADDGGFEFEHTGDAIPVSRHRDKGDDKVGKESA